MGSEGLEVTVAGAAQNQQMSTSPVDVADPRFPTLAEEAAQKAMGVAEILQPETQEAAMEVGKASAQAQKKVGGDATVKEVAKEAGEILKSGDNTADTALAPSEEGTDTETTEEEISTDAAQQLADALAFTKTDDQATSGLASEIIDLLGS